MQRLLSSQALQKVSQISPKDLRMPPKVWQSLTNPNLALVGGGIGTLALLLLNGPLAAIAVLSLGVGLVVYLHQLDRLYVRWLPWRRWWRPANRPLTLALVSIASTVTVGIFLHQLWQRSPWPGLTTLVLAQTLMMATVVAIALRRRGANSLWGTAPQQLASPPLPAQAVEPILMALAATHPIHQLVAIRRALRWAKTTQDAAALNDIADCFVLMLCHHPDPIVQRALQQGLQQLSPLTPLTFPKAIIETPRGGAAEGASKATSKAATSEAITSEATTPEIATLEIATEAPREIPTKALEAAALPQPVPIAD